VNIVVFGSINMDLTSYVPRLPRPGETLRGSSYIIAPGGKGNNQAVAASRLGAQVRFIGRVGDDGFGREVLKIVTAENVDTSLVKMDAAHGTGLAVISVDENAENSIIIVSGANMALDQSDFEKANLALKDSRVLLVQLEVNMDATLQVVKRAHEIGVKVVFDPAPAQAIPMDAFQQMDVITPNEIETEVLLGLRPTDEASAEHAADEFLKRGVETAVIKLGSKGVYFKNSQDSGFVAPYKVKAVDSVAAGDAFNSGLAVALSEGKSMAEAVRWGAGAGALATTRKGAMPSMPYRAELLKLLEEQG
jgi:ribokinase